MTILIISHTAHYYNKEGEIVGWGPTVKELDYVAESFGSVIHIGCLYKNEPAPNSAIPYKNKNVRFVPIPPFGGSGLKKLSIVTNAFKILSTIKKELRNADIFQFRAPTSMGLYVIPYLTWFTKKKGWFKYAGNWDQKNPPASYAIQKNWLLNKQNRKVTINGKWPGQPEKCITFENPCLSNADRKDGKTCMDQKTYEGPFTFCFVGRVEEEKGIFRIIEALQSYPHKSRIGKLEVVGDGRGMEELLKLSKTLSFPMQIHGPMNRAALFNIYSRSDFFILPSNASEGFPKVIAEAANFGCIPIVSDISSVGQYINSSNGFVWNIGKSSFSEFFNGLELDNTAELKTKALNAYKFAESFTYERYVEHLKEIF